MGAQISYLRGHKAALIPPYREKLPCIIYFCASELKSYLLHQRKPKPKKKSGRGMLHVVHIRTEIRFDQVEPQVLSLVLSTIRETVNIHLSAVMV